MAQISHYPDKERDLENEKCVLICHLLGRILRIGNSSVLNTI